MNRISNCILAVMASALLGQPFAMADESEPQDAEPSSKTQRIQMHEIPSVSTELGDETEYLFGERSDDLRLREHVFESPAPIDPSLFMPPVVPAREPERKKNWLTPRSNMDRIQGGEEDESESRRTEDNKREGPSRGWLVDDVMSRLEDRSTGDEDTDEEETPYPEEESISVFEADDDEPEAEESDSPFNVYAPTADYLDEKRPGSSEGYEQQIISIAEDGASPETRREETPEQVYHQPIQWGGVQGAEGPLGINERSASFSVSEGFISSSPDAGGIDQLNQQISQTLSQPSHRPSEGSLQPGSAPRTPFNETATIRSTQFTSPAFSTGGVSGEMGRRRTADSAGFSSWSPSGPQQPVQAFEPLSDR